MRILAFSDWRVHSIEKLWMFSQEKINEMEKEGLIKPNAKGKPIYKVKIMDFSLGSSTTTAVAHKPGRKWIGVDPIEPLIWW